MRLFLLITASYSLLVAAALPPQCTTKVLQKLSENVKITKAAKPQNDVDIYLNKAIPEYTSNAFADVFVKTSLSDSSIYRIYQGPNCSSVIEQYENDNRIFGLFKSFNPWRTTSLYPFNDTYVGIETTEAYSVEISVWNPNYIRVGLFIGGCLLFLFASSLARNVIFYYTSGCSLGLLASVLIIAIIVYRVAPKKTIGIPILVGGWSFAAYMLNFAWTNLYTILQDYQEYVIGYFTFALLISFAVCYKRGPPTDVRSHDIAQWTLQLIALGLIYFSTVITRVAVAVIVILILHQGTKSWLWRFIGKIFSAIIWLWQKVFPPTRKLLSEAEYIQQTKEATAKELEKLREFCRSPAANAWKITHSVKDPKKLARFIDGSEGHVSDDEILEHDLESELLERRSEEPIVTDDDYEHEVIIRRRNRNGIVFPDDSMERSFVIPKGVSTHKIFQQISMSAIIEKKKGKPAIRSRHSIGGAATIISAPSRQSSSLTKSRQAMQSNKQNVDIKKKPSPQLSRSHYADYFSSDSEDQNDFEEDLLAQKGDFDFEKD